MTPEQAKANQKRISKHYKLGWWYGVNCVKCCGVYPKLMTEGPAASQMAFYQCEVCGKRTKGFQMPWIAEAAWNNNEFKNEGFEQISFL